MAVNSPQVTIRCGGCGSQYTLKKTHFNLDLTLNELINRLTHKMDCYGRIVKIEDSDERIVLERQKR
jgi:uncharacterized protein (UPF0248 family)